MTEDIEKKARQMGWAPQEEFKGDPEKWVDADKFVERGETIVPILKERLDKALNKVEGLETTTLGLQKSLSRITDYHKKVSETEFKRAKSEFDKEVKDIKKKMRKAVKDGDEDTYDALEEDLESLSPPEEPEDPKDDPDVKSKVDPAYQEWVKDNKWFENNAIMRGAALGVEQELRSQNPNLSGKELFDAVTERMKDEFPTKFKNEKREQPGAVEGGGAEVREKDKNTKTFDDLPAEAKKEFKELQADFKEAGHEFTKEKYLEQYDWGA